MKSQQEREKQYFDDWEIPYHAECLGDRKAEVQAKLDEEYPGWEWGFWVEIQDEKTGIWSEHLLSFEEILGWYLQAYLILAEEAPTIFQALAKQANEIYESDPVNDRKSGTDLKKQLSPANHYMDIIIRQVFEVFGWSFEGDQLVQIGNGPDINPETGLRWFDHFTPSGLTVLKGIRPSAKVADLPLLTDPCSEEWHSYDGGERISPESIYQLSRVARRKVVV